MPFFPEDHPGHAHLRFSAPNTPAGSVRNCRKASDFLKFYPDVTGCHCVRGYFSFILFTWQHFCPLHILTDTSAIVYSINPKRDSCLQENFYGCRERRHIDTWAAADYARSNKIRSRLLKEARTAWLRRYLHTFEIPHAKLAGNSERTRPETASTLNAGLYDRRESLCKCMELHHLPGLLTTFSGPHEILSLSDEELLNFITEKDTEDFPIL